MTDPTTGLDPTTGPDATTKKIGALEARIELLEARHVALETKMLNKTWDPRYPDLSRIPESERGAWHARARANWRNSKA